ncbi:MAG: HAD family hydrolase [Clostridiales bacterium]|nr:HAD family hydrolase [Clostridiales bacterium]
MKPKMILFDLDGTLLPMDQDVFVKAYFGAIAKKLAPRGYEPQKLVQSIWIGTKAMIKNDGSKKNEQAFWDTFAGIYGEQVRDEIVYFDEFYVQNFDDVQASCGFNVEAAKTVRALKEAGYRLALATNPIFPSIATEKRMRWAGLDKSDFELYTTYENSRYCKPNLKYYEDILTALDVKAEDCLMVGNDVGEDMIVEKLGMKVFLLTDCLINRENKDLSAYPHGSFVDLLAFVESL